MLLAKTSRRWSHAAGKSHLRLSCSGSEQRMLRLIASIADGIPVDLQDTLTSIDDHNIQLLLQAVLRVRKTAITSTTLIISKFREERQLPRPAAPGPWPGSPPHSASTPPPSRAPLPPSPRTPAPETARAAPSPSAVHQVRIEVVMLNLGCSEPR